MMYATVEDESFSFPCRALAAGKIVHFEDLGMKPIHLPVTACSQTSKPRTDDDYGLIRHLIHLIHAVFLEGAPTSELAQWYFKV